VRFRTKSKRHLRNQTNRGSVTMMPERRAQGRRYRMGQFAKGTRVMTLKYVLLAGAAMIFAPATASTALAQDDDTYVCNGELCHDDQADDTRALNNQALEQAQEENEDDDSAYAPASGPDMYGDDDDNDMNPYDNDDDDDDDGA
jgi:hypothetical protein